MGWQRNLVTRNDLKAHGCVLHTYISMASQIQVVHVPPAGKLHPICLCQGVSRFPLGREFFISGEGFIFSRQTSTIKSYSKCLAPHERCHDTMTMDKCG